MSIDLKDFMVSFTHDSKGAGGTRHKANQVFHTLQSFAKSNCWGKTTPQNITSKQVHGYLTERAKTVSARSVQNEASIIRRVVTGAGRNVGDLKDLKNNWGNQRLGVPSATRISHKPAMDKSTFEKAREQLSKEVGVIVDLQKDCGLRAQEAVKAQNVESWERELNRAVAEKHGAYLEMTADAGSKGGRPRHIYIPENRAADVLKTVSAAVVAKRENGGRILSQYDNLKDALKGYQNALVYRGLTGTNSNHALRRSFAVSQYAYYLSSGFDKKTALSRLSLDLGHGDGRGRWVENNYLQGV